MNENAPVTVNVFANDIQGADSVLPGTVAAVAGTLSGAGQLTNNGDGSFTYTPAPAEQGTVTFDYSITDGLISSVRPLSDDMTILQISAAISQGSSGGPLFNQFGEVIGVTTAIITQGQLINLAVPANYLKPLMQHPIAMTFDDFAEETKDSETAESADDIPIQRKIPEHPVTIWTGCSEKQMEEVLRSIGDAIAIGAPLYNRK